MWGSAPSLSVCVNLVGERVSMCVGQLPLCLCVFVVCTSYSCFGTAHILPCFFVSLFVASSALVHFPCSCVKKQLQTGRVQMLFISIVVVLRSNCRQEE